MNLPPRIKTQHPNGQNIVYDVDTPIPIESAFFLEDAKQDPNKPNRYYFNFPGNWITSNNGETIIGIRDIWLNKKRMKLEFNLHLVKYKKEAFENHKKQFIKWTYDAIIDDIISAANIYSSSESSQHTIQFLIYLSENESHKDFIQKVLKAIYQYAGSITNYNDFFAQSLDNDADCDVMLEGSYENKNFHLKIYSPRNKRDKEYGVAFKLAIKDQNQDLKDFFNIGEGPNENNPYNYSAKWKEELVFDNLWDREMCVIYSSIAEQAHHGYIGKSEVYFCPIKYYKLKSTDQQFWIEFYSSIERIPVKLPKGESFCMEMQFLPYNKMLQI